MSLGLIGKKIGMTQVFEDNSELVPVTIIQAGPCFVIQIKTEEKDGYNALQLGYVAAKKVNKPIQGHCTKSDRGNFRIFKEFAVEDIENYTLGQEINIGIFSIGDRITITGNSKGKGFAGVMKRWGFGGGPASHGSKTHRRPGSIGASATPSRVLKGKKLPGHKGNEKNTIKKCKIVNLMSEENIIMIKGQVPGSRNQVVLIYK
ncbi:MAG: 50S ribosomal protein L3 [Thermodesulfobacteriota bacterium]|nr:50S ribosomal protein L3 [Thermodesulfobacteriota bacterium]